MNLAEMKDTLAYACKVLAFAGQTDGIWGHVTFRLPGKDAFLMKAHELGLEEITPEGIVTVSMSGEKLDGAGKVHSEVPIHAEILRARPEVNCVVHTHPAAPIVFSALDRPMLPISNESCIFFNDLSVYSGTTDLIREKSRGEEVAQCLGKNRAMLMRNHGIVTAGTTVGEAVLWAIFLDQACKKQLTALQCGGAKHWSPAEEAEAKKWKHGGKPGSGRMDVAFAYYVRQVKKMEGAG